MKKINSLQFGSFLVMLIASPLLGKGMYGIIKASGVDAWISLILSFFVGVIIIIGFMYIFNYEPDLKLSLKINRLFGIKIGTIINYLLSIVIFINAISLFYDLTGFITSQFLSETPIFFIGLMFISVIIYINTKGIEVMSRVSFLMVIVCFILFLVNVVGLIGGFELSNIKPILEFGISKPLKGIPYIVLLNILPVMILLDIPKNSIIDIKNVKKSVILYYIMSMVILFFVVFLTIGNLGIELCNNYLYPEYVILKSISFFNFIDRIENVIMLQWVLSLFINISLCVNFISSTVSKKRSNIIIYIVSSLIVLLSNTVFKNNTIFGVYVYNISIYVKYVMVFIIALIIFMIKTKRIASKRST